MQEEKFHITKGDIIFFVVILSLFVLKYAFCLKVINGSSMFPTYHDGQLITANRFIDQDDVKRNDVVIFYPEKQKSKTVYVKRVVGLPGETVQIKNGQLYIDGQLYEDKFATMDDAGIADSPITLQDGEFFVLGDNRNNSVDGRFIGPINIDSIIGIVND